MYGPPGSEVRVFSNVCCWGAEGLLDLFWKYTFEADFYFEIYIIKKYMFERYDLGYSIK